MRTKARRGRVLSLLWVVSTSVTCRAAAFAAVLVVGLSVFVSTPAMALQIAFAVSGVPVRDAAGQLTSIEGALVPTSPSTPLFTDTATPLPGSVVVIVAAPGQDLRRAPGHLTLATASGGLAATPRPVETGGAWSQPGTRFLPPWDGAPLDPAYDPRVDGCVMAGFDGLGPAGSCAGVSLVDFPADQRWESEMAVFSWNYMQVLVSFSAPDSNGVIDADEFDPFTPMRLDGCSHLNPLACRSVQEVQDVLGLIVRPLPDDPNGTTAGWVWDRSVSWEVTEASGDLAPYLGSTLLSYGPFDDGAGGARTALVLVPEPASAGFLLAGLAALRWRARRGRSRG